MDWKKVNLHGSGGIARVCGEYVIADTRIPGAKYRIKVLERESDFFAVPNVAVRGADGEADWIGGGGGTEVEALQGAIANLGGMLAAKREWSEDEVVWSDAVDF
jgi:hypothetical protein